LKIKFFRTAGQCAFLIEVLFVTHLSLAQQTGQKAPPQAPEPQSTSEAAAPLKAGADFVQLLERKSMVFPDLAVDTASLSTGQKFKLAANNSVSLSTITASALGSAGNQALNEPEGYGQGMSGYGKRFGSSMARAASNQFFGTFLLASALHQDPRFFVKQDLTFGGSVKYAVNRVFLTRSDDGQQVVNWSGLAAPLATETLANTYFPQGDRSAGDVFARYGYDLLWKAAGNLGKQYWPKINKRLKLQTPTTYQKP